MAFFISLEGIDGAGKSTTARIVAETLGLHEITKKSISSDDIFCNEQISKIRSANYPGYNGMYDSKMSSLYWLHLQAVWYTLVYDHAVLPKLQKNTPVLVDGWYYKFLAKIQRELTTAQIFDLSTFSLVPQPDFVIHLDLDPELALKRRSDFTHYEAGSHSGMPMGSDSFLSFQDYIRKNITKMYDDRWSRLPIDRNDSELDVARNVSSIIKAKFPNFSFDENQQNL